MPLLSFKIRSRTRKTLDDAKKFSFLFSEKNDFSYCNLRNLIGPLRCTQRPFLKFFRLAPESFRTIPYLEIVDSQREADMTNFNEHELDSHIDELSRTDLNAVIGGAASGSIPEAPRLTSELAAAAMGGECRYGLAPPGDSAAHLQGIITPVNRWTTVQGPAQLTCMIRGKKALELRPMLSFALH